MEPLLARAIALLCTPTPLDAWALSELLDLARTLELLSQQREPTPETLEAELTRASKSPLTALDRARLLDLPPCETASADIYRLLVLAKAHVISDPPLARRLALQVLIAFHALEMKHDRTLLESFTTKYRPNLERLARAIDLEALNVFSAETAHPNERATPANRARENISQLPDD